MLTKVRLAQRRAYAGCVEEGRTSGNGEEAGGIDGRSWTQRGSDGKQHDSEY